MRKVALIAEEQLEVVKGLLTRIAHLEMQMRQPRVCQHEPESVRYFLLLEEGIDVLSDRNRVGYLCKHCRTLYIPKK